MCGQFFLLFFGVVYLAVPSFRLNLVSIADSGAVAFVSSSFYLHLPLLHLPHSRPPPMSCPEEGKMLYFIYYITLLLRVYRL